MGLQREEMNRALKVVTGVLGGNSAGQGFWDDHTNAIDVYFEEARQERLEKLLDSGLSETEAQEQLEEDMTEWESGTYWLVGSWKKYSAGENIHGYAPDKDNGDYAAIYDSNDNYIQVVWSKTIAYCNLCSPCFPNQGDLDSPGHDVVAYCLPKDCLDDAWLAGGIDNFPHEERIMYLPTWESMQFWLNHVEQMNGSFRTALWDAIFKADLSNLRKLQKGFPEEVRCRCNYGGIKL